ncbi:MAG: acetylglutamate kinase [Firmicutes bacterium]|nr:acetylglutamate kinase [Bacillota bacterium]MCL5040399.1 acetylglutamate kinase [Bacillota bacterium]
MLGVIEKASVLVEALPYIKFFSGKTVVIKYGGNAMLNEELKNSVMQDIVLMKFVGINPVVIHGGGPEITALMKRLGKQPQFVDGLRVTDAETVEIAEMVLSGKLSKEIVSLIQRHGGKAVGLSGKDGGLFRAEKHYHRVEGPMGPERKDIGFVGDIVEVNPELLENLIRASYIPVISSIAYGAGGETYNINADTAAGKLAAALKADKLVLLTDVEGIFDDYQDKTTLISTLKVADIPGKIQKGGIDGGMVPKVEACVTALEGGVTRTHIIDGRIPHSLLLEVFTQEGVGTMVVKD